MRIHRIGQTKKVSIKRFIVKVFLISQFWEIMHICNVVVLLYILNWALVNCFTGYKDSGSELVKFLVAKPPAELDFYLFIVNISSIIFLIEVLKF